VVEGISSRTVERIRLVKEYGTRRIGVSRSWANAFGVGR